MLWSLQKKGFAVLKRRRLEKGWTIPHKECHCSLNMDFLLDEADHPHSKYTRWNICLLSIEWRKRCLFFINESSVFDATSISRYFAVSCSVNGCIEHKNTSLWLCSIHIKRIFLHVKFEIELSISVVRIGGAHYEKVKLGNWHVPKKSQKHFKCRRLALWITLLPTRTQPHK